MAAPLPSLEVLHQLLICEGASGKLFWRKRSPIWWEKSSSTKTPEHCAQSWNTRFAGKEAFTSSIKGYKSGNILGNPYRAHRIIWSMHNGALIPPRMLIDHINGDRADNRAVNLRATDHFGNARNRRKPTTNVSGHTGLWRDNVRNRWIVHVYSGGAEKPRVGAFKTLHKALAARDEAYRKHGYSRRHGQ